MRSMTLVLLAGLALGCGGGNGGGGGDGDGVTTPPPPPPSGNVVSAVGVTAWSPAAITIRAGEIVSFRDPSSTAHSVQFDQGVAGHPGNVPDFAATSKSVTFATAGTFPYHCGIHPAMQGRVVVQP